MLIRGEKEWELWILIRDQNHLSKRLEVEEHVIWDEGNLGKVTDGAGVGKGLR